MIRITLDKIINLILFLYIISLYLFNYRENLFVISNGFALLFVFLVIIRCFINNFRFIINKYLLYHLLFIFICLFSVFYAVSPNEVISEVRTLILIFVVMISIVNFINTTEKINLVIKAFIIAGLISSIYILLVSDFTNITRFGGELGNVNDVGMMIGISSVFSFNEYCRIKKMKYLIFGIPMSIVILLTGSRKALLFLMLSVLFMIYINNKKNLKGKIKFLIVGITVFLILFYIVFKVSFFYNIIGKRMEGIIALIIGKGRVDNSLITRKYMIEYGLRLFRHRPLLGYGARNYRILYGMEHGINRYAHNNFVELLVNIGVIGTFFYYLTNFKIVKDLIIFIKSSHNYEISLQFIVIIVAYFLLGTSMIYYYNKHYSFILALASVIPKVYNIKK